MIRVLIADDQRVFRTVISKALSAVPGFEIVGRAADGDEALRLTLEHCPDIVLMDVSMPVLSGIEATRLIRRLCPETQVVGLSIHESAEIEETMRSAGAAAYVAKGRHLETLVPTLYDVWTATESDSNH